MDFNEFKELISNKLKEISPPLSKEALIRLRTELFHAKIYFDDIGDLYEDLKTKPVKTEAGIIPYILGVTTKFDLNIPMELTQTTPGASGGI